MEKKVSIPVIKRLPRYYRFLGELLYNGVTRISSKDLSTKMNVTASQIRQDLNNFGCFGQQGYGYNVESLYKEIKTILGLNKTYNLILVGAGNIGQALLNHTSFQRKGFKFIGIFDINKKVIDKTINNIQVMHISQMREFTNENVVDMVVLTVPRNSVKEIVEIIYKTDIKAIWNFSNAEIKAYKNIIVENVHLTDSLMTLTYKFNTNGKILED